MPIDSCDFFDIARGQIPDVEIAPAASEKYLVALRQEEGGCSDGCVFDMYGREERVWCRVCCGLDVMEVESRG